MPLSSKLCSRLVFESHNVPAELLVLFEGNEPLNEVDLVNLNKKVLHACCNGDLKKVKQLIRQGAEVNVVDTKGATPLHLASKKGYTKIVKFLIKKGANVNAIDTNGAIPLHCAYFNNHNEIVELFIEEKTIANKVKEELFCVSCLGDKVELVKLFIKHGFNVNVENAGKPLAWACSAGNIEIAKVLIENGANVNVIDLDGKTLLCTACSKGRTEIAKLLIENGVNINEPGTSSVTPLFHAYFNNHNEIVELLIKHNETDHNSKKTLLYFACLKGCTDTVRLLINHGVSVNTNDNGEESILGLACSEGHTEIVKFLIDNGVNVNTVNNYGEPPLSLACSGNHSEIVKLLTDAGADINVTNNRRATPLYTACYKNRTEVSKLLMNKGADVNCASNSGRTPLYHAAKKGSRKTVKSLLKYGASVGVPSHSGRTPLCRAQVGGHTEIVELLIYSALLQHVEEKTPKFIEHNEKLSSVWIKLREIEAIKKLSSGIEFSLYDLLEKDLDVLAKMIKKRDLIFLKKQKFPEYTDCLKKRLEEIFSTKEKRNEMIDFLTNNSALSSLSKVSGQEVRLDGYPMREVLNYLNISDLETLNEAARVPFPSTHKQTDFFSPVESLTEDEGGESNLSLFSDSLSSLSLSTHRGN